MFKDHGGLLRTSEALKAGIHPRILYELRDSGLIEQLAKGLYGIPGLPDVEQPDLATVAKKVPAGVICLLSALYFHGLTVQIPRWVDVAIPPKFSPPSLEYPPVQFHWYSDAVFRAGVEEHGCGTINIKIYSKEKSIVDCFRLRSSVGIDIALEALKTYWLQGNADLKLLNQFAKTSRVLRIMEPYVGTVIHD